VNKAIWPSAEPVSAAFLPYWLKISDFFSAVKYIILFFLRKFVVLNGLQKYDFFVKKCYCLKNNLKKEIQTVYSYHDLPLLG
jgi:hypothetical protein